MKFWLLTSEFPPAYGGGIGTYSAETARIMAANGHEVIVITQDFSQPGLWLEKQEGFTLARFNPSGHYTAGFMGYEANLSYGFAQAVRQLVESYGAPDLIESQEYMGICYYLLQYKWLRYPVFRDLKVMITLHAPSFLYLEYNQVPHYQLPYFWVGEMERFCIRAADLLISPSAYLVKELQGRVETKDLTIHVIPNPYSAKPAEVPQVGKDIVFFGKLTPQKGCLQLLAYCKQMWENGAVFTLTMIGGGDHMFHTEGMDMIDFLAKKYKEEIKSGKVKLLGSLKPEEAMLALTNARAVVIPSIVDNLPYTVYEAMGLGKVVLASRQGGQSEIIRHATDGFLFDHEVPNNFSEQLKHILSLSQDEIKRIGKNAAKKIAESYSYNKIYSQKQPLCEQLVSRNTRSTEFPLARPFSPVPREQIRIEAAQPLLSVVIPYYNMSAFVEDALQSVRASGYKNIEILVVDDGSNQKEASFLHGIRERYLFTIVRQQNAGLAAARNAGASAARGALLAFLDPDDTVEPQYYEKAAEVLTHYNNVGFVGCWARYLGEAHGYWPAFNPEPPYLLFHNMINSSALVCKKDVFLKAGLNDPDMIYGMEDYESVIAMVSAGYAGVVLPEPLWNYRVRKNSMARKFTNNKQVYLYHLIAKKHTRIFSIFAADLACLHTANGPGYKYDNPTVFYNLPAGIVSNRIKSKVVALIKSNPLLRKIAIRVKNALYK